MANEAADKIIDGESFKISRPYLAGHVLNEIEAKTLNQVRAENIGNNLRTAVKEAKEARDKGDPKAFDGLKDLVAKYDADYKFELGGGGGRRMDPVEREAHNLAIEAVKADLAGKGRTMKQVPEGLTKEQWEAKLEAAIDTVAAKEEILKLAKSRVAQKQKIGAGALGDLLA